MRTSHIRLAALALTSGLLLGGCAYDDYGYGYGPYGGYGYPHSSVSIGVGYGGGYGGYGYGSYGYGYPYGGYYGGYGYPYGGYGAYGGYGYDPFGWYGNYYYPGSGVYVYDRSRTRHVWSGDQQRYWQQRTHQWQNQHSGTAVPTNENWSGWDRRNRASTSSTWTRGANSNWTRTNPQATTTTTTTNTSGTQGTRGNRGRHHGNRDD